MAKKLKSIDYPYISAYVRAKENKMLNSERAERMINAKSVKDAVKVLEECGYGDMSDVNASRLYDFICLLCGVVMKDLAFLVPDKEILDIFRLKYDYHNAKAILKALAMGQDYGYILRAKGMVPCEDGQTWLHFDLVPEEFQIREGAADYTGRLCVIGSDLKEDQLEKLFLLA